MWAALLLATLSQARPPVEPINFEPDAGFARVLPAPWPDVISGAELVTLAGLEPVPRKNAPARVNWMRTLELAADVDAVKRLVLEPTHYAVLDHERCSCGFVKLCGRCDTNLELTFVRGTRRIQFRICFHCSQTEVILFERSARVTEVAPDLGNSDEWLRVLAALAPDDDFVAARKRRHDELELRILRHERTRDGGSAPAEGN